MKLSFSKRISILSVVYLAAALLYILLSIHGKGKLAEPIPILLLFIASVRYLPWRLSNSFLFAAIGDIFGSCTSILPQTASYAGLVGGFALSHVFLVSFFISFIIEHRIGAPSRKKASRKEKVRSMRIGWMYAMMVMLLVWGLLYYAFVAIIPSVPSGFFRTATIVYTVIIAAMLFFALMTEDWVWGLGAMLFVVSDIMLAYDIFIFGDTSLNIILMPLYYCAQLIIFSRACTRIKLNEDNI